MRSDSRKGNNQARNVFDEMARSEFEECRSPNRILEVAIHKVCYPISESVLHQIFGRFGKVEDVYVCMGVEHVKANAVFQSKLEAAEAYGELHGRNIYDGCCQMEIKWGRHNTSKCLSAQAAPELPPVALATPSTTTVVNPDSEFATSQHVSAEDDTTSTTPTRCSTHVPTPTLAPINNATATSASSTPTKALGGLAAAPTTCLRAQLVVPTCPPAPAVRGAQEDIPTKLPTKCSAECLSHGIDVLKSMDTVTGIWNAPLTMFSFTGDIPLDINRDNSLKHLQGRTNWSTLVFGPLPVYLFDKEKWPPPIQLVMQTIGDPLRPIPWPSFGYFADHWADLWIPWKIPWLFSASSCWISYAFPAVTVITRAHMLFFEDAIAAVTSNTVELHFCYYELLSDLPDVCQRDLLQCLSSRVQQQQFSVVPTTCIIVHPHLFLWDPGSDLYFLDGCNSFDCLLELKARQVSMYLIKRSWLTILPIVVADPATEVQVLAFHQVNVLLTSIIMNEQFILWDPDGDQCLLAEFQSINGLGNLQMQLTYLSYVKKRGWLVLLQFLSIVDWPSQRDNDNILLGYFTREGRCIVLKSDRYHITPWPPPTGGMHVNMEIFRETRTLLSGQSILLPAWLIWMNDPVVNHICFVWYVSFINGCESLDCLIHLDVRQLVLYMVKGSWGPHKQFLTQIIYQFSTVKYSVSPSVSPLLHWKIHTQLVKLYGGIIGSYADSTKELSVLNTLLYQHCNSCNWHNNSGQGLMMVLIRELLHDQSCMVDCHWSLLVFSVLLVNYELYQQQTDGIEGHDVHKSGHIWIQARLTRPTADYWRCLKYMFVPSIKGILGEYNSLSMGYLPTDSLQLKDGYFSNVLVAKRLLIHMMDQCWQFKNTASLFLSYSYKFKMNLEEYCCILHGQSSCNTMCFILLLQWQINLVFSVAVIKTTEDAYENSEICSDVCNIIFILLFYNMVIEDP